MTVKANSSPRQVARVIPSVETSDGGGRETASQHWQ